VKKTFLFVLVALCCTSPLKASTGPPIDAAALAGYGYGTLTIAGSAKGYRGGTVACAPDIAYVEWYILTSARPQDYDSRLAPYTKVAWVNDDGSFACTGLGPGRYIVWAALQRNSNRQFSDSTESYSNDERVNAAGRPPTVDSSGEMVPAAPLSFPPAPWWTQLRGRGATVHDPTVHSLVHSAPVHIVLTSKPATVNF
jgi:hypothetical protein